MPSGVYQRKPMSEEHRKKISLGLMGKKLTLKHRKNLSFSHLGQKPWNKGIKAKDDSRIAKFVEAGHNALRGTQAWNRSNIMSKCKTCGKFFHTTPARLKGGRGKYCSKNCKHRDSKGKTPWNKNLKLPQFSGKQHPRWNGGLPRCKECEKTLGSYKGKYCPQCFNKKFLSGTNHWCWNGGITPVNEKIRKSKKYKNWRKKVFERDDYTCRLCGRRGGILHADHIKSFAIFPKLRFEPDNGRTLCKPCHIKTDTYGRKYERSIC